MYVDTHVKNNSDVIQKSDRSSIKHSKLQTTENIEMDKHHDYEEVEVKKGRIESPQTKDSLTRVKCILWIMAVVIIVIFAILIYLTVILYQRKIPNTMSAFTVNTPYSYRSHNGTSKLTFAKTIYQYGQDFDMTTGTFTCSIPGIYHFSVTMVRKGPLKMNSTIHCKIHRRKYKEDDISIIRIADTDCRSISQSFVTDLDIRDTVYLGTCHDEDTYIHLEWWSSFTGFLLHPNKT